MSNKTLCKATGSYLVINKLSITKLEYLISLSKNYTDFKNIIKNKKSKFIYWINELFNR